MLPAHRTSPLAAGPVVRHNRFTNPTCVLFHWPVPCRRLPTGQQLVYFFSFLGGGVLFLFMAFFIGLPTLLLSPSKFALFFTLGCCFVMSGFASLKGWRSQMAHMLERERLPFSAGASACVVHVGHSTAVRCRQQ